MLTMVNRRQAMQERELHVYHIVTREKMALGQIISFDNLDKDNADVAFKYVEQTTKAIRK
jgi:hypothetical protein